MRYWLYGIRRIFFAVIAETVEDNCSFCLSLTNNNDLCLHKFVFHFSTKLINRFYCFQPQITHFITLKAILKNPLLLAQKRITLSPMIHDWTILALIIK